MSEVTLRGDGAHLRRREDEAQCRRILRAGSKSFHLASLLLPPEMGRGSAALYAMCRVADDAVDEPGADARALDRLVRRVRRAIAGRPQDGAVDRAFADVVERFRIPAAIPEALLEGFAWDVEGRRYEDPAALEGYAVRVASTVGLMMTLLTGIRDRHVLARAADLGVAMQLTNIARDVGEDARRGRVYLPLQWLDEEGVDPAELVAAPRFSAGLGRVVRRLLASAEQAYARADAGIAALPFTVRPAIRLARSLYAAIGDEAAARGYDTVSSRAVVPRGRKMWLALRALVGGRRSPALLDEPVPAVVPLLEAVRP